MVQVISQTSASATRRSRGILIFLSCIFLSACGYVLEDEIASPPLPSADFVGTPVSGTPPLTVTFANRSTGDAEAYEWDFDGDGTVDSTTSGNVTHEYNEEGTFSVGLTATGEWGSNTRERADYIRVLPVTPIPQTIGGLSLWLKADAIAGLNDGDPVDTWSDSSGNGNHATQGGANRPTYKTSVVNGEPVVRFDGTNNYLDIPSMSLQPATVFVVVKYDLPAVNAPFLGNDANSAYFGYYSNIIYYYSTIASISVANPTPGTFQVITGHAQPFGSNSSIRIDGASVVQGSRNWGASAFLFVGRRNAERFDGDIAEVLIYNNNLSSPDVDTVEGYLGDKYSIAIP